VYYLLHGMPGRPQVYVDIANMDVRLDNALTEGLVRPMILVFPDGRIGGSTYSDSEWANTRSGRFESYVLDVVSDVDRRFSTVPDRRHRAIGGFSAGAYGAINIALHNLSTFAFVQSWSGYFTQTRTGVFAHADHATLAYNSPLGYVPTLRRALSSDPLRVFMFVGRDDRSSRQIVPMARALARSGAIAHYAIYRGGHDWQVWYPRLNQMLISASRDFTTPHLLSALRRDAVAAHAWRRHRYRRRRLAGRAVARGERRWRAVVRDPAHRVQLNAPAAVTPQGAAGLPQAVPPRPRHGTGLTLLAGLILALLSAAAINLGFLFQHRGLAEVRSRGARAHLAVLRSRTWIGGQALGWAGFAAQIIAVALAPLSVVQAFAAGGLAISVPFAAAIFGHRVSREQALAVLSIAASLALLPLALPRVHAHLSAGILMGGAALAIAVSVPLAFARSAAAWAIAAGVIYGAADAAIKAVSVGWQHHGAAAVVSGWTVLAMLATFGGFLAFQAALRIGDAVSAISLMTALTALVALAFGVLAFGESLGAGPGAVIVHLLAISTVLGCVRVLADAQQQIAEDPGAQQRPPRGRALGTAARRAGAAAGAFVLVLLSLCAGLGLLYTLRGLGWFSQGPRISDSLPLLQLAGFDAQPLARVALAWLLVGAAVGVVLIDMAPSRRALAAAVLGIVLLVIASDASFALARNLRFDHVLWSRPPSLGAVVGGLLFALGAALPRRVGEARAPVVARLLAAVR
jgi:enterochelin esterase-like enzyme